MGTPDDYGWVLFMDLLILIQYITITYAIVTPTRRKVFTPQFLKDNFGEVFTDLYKKDPDPMGYPDMGCGRFADKLAFPEWYEFNNAQRTMYNYLEQIPVPLVCIPIAGYEFEYYTIGFAAGYIIGRTIYTLGYVKSGSKGRLIGAYTLDISSWVAGDCICIMLLHGLRLVHYLNKLINT